MSEINTLHSDQPNDIIMKDTEPSAKNSFAEGMDIDKAQDGKENQIDEPKNEQKSKTKKKKRHKRMQFRNYIPKDDQLKRYCVEPTQPIEFSQDFEELIQNSKILNHASHEITPKKANWDLKRDIQPQFDQLEYLTTLAIRKILKQKQAEEGSDEESDASSQSEDENNAENNEEAENNNQENVEGDIETSDKQ
ncbi:hypothetical protein RFI_11117 [Reticulomyxa filosa]|uniref:Uncharacterized protein n=1 Tax=Reticulomyxa filosa TaxID=46433 RepID=X6NJ50_RETFI|nr:hypothetical protein RFI_11117 [Reticulomyxa filosa]|eukprot:ETO26021.1 hypothetical protein RFI_11117 [Reticulomyxa filosa]